MRFDAMAGKNGGRGMTIALGADPGGYELKVEVKKYLVRKGHDVLDLGTQDAEHPVWYMDVGRNVAKAVASGKVERGVVICATGMGISIATNKNIGARCAFVESYWAARESRIVNDANIIAIGGTTTSLRMACEMIDVFLDTEFAHGVTPERRTRLESGAAKWLPYESEVFKS